MHTCGQCEYYLTKMDECPHPEKRTLDKACDKLQYTNPRKRIDYLEAENKEFVGIIDTLKETIFQELAKNRLLEADNKRLQFKIDKLNSTEFVSHTRSLIADNKRLKEVMHRVDVWLSCLPDVFKPIDLPKP